MEWAQALEGPHTRRLERDVRRDDLVDASAVANGVNVLASDQASHDPSLRGRPDANPRRACHCIAETSVREAT